jgi:ribosomal protein L11 methylase PrmA
MQKIPGSFRDPSGSVFNYQNKIIRSVSKIGEQKYLHVKNKNIIEESIKNNFLINTFEIEDVLLKEKLNCSFLLEHQKLEYVSYPYEWSFEQLRDAAIHHLNYQTFLLEKGFELIDASAYNVQFIRGKPIFIDCLSLNKYQEGSPWFGHNQFCEQFLNPLLFTSSTKVLFNNWYKGSLEGLKNNEIARILNLSLKINPVVFFNILLPNLFDKFSKKKNLSDLALVKNNRIKNNFNKNSYFWLIRSLKKFISNIKNPLIPTFWGRYNEEKTYSDINYNKKKEIVRNFIIKNNIKKVVDLGCNDGDFSELCLINGAEHVVGLDYDHISLEKSYLRSKTKNLNFLPLYFDAANPSSNIGWYQNERYGFLERCNFDGLIALAFEHHLAIAKNIPLEELIKWFLDIAPLGLIEFVPKNDKTVGIMLSLKGDIFPDYNEENFRKILAKLSNIVSVSEVGDSGRKIYEYKKLR